MDTQLKYLIIIYTIATILTFALDWQLPGFEQVAHLSKKIDLDRYLIPDYMTYWQCTHFLTRFLLGFFCPNYWHVIFVVDFGWETLEWYQWNAHNWYDLIWNMLGLITGITFRYYGMFDKYFGFDKSGNVQNKDDSTGNMTSETKNDHDNRDDSNASNDNRDDSNASNDNRDDSNASNDRGDPNASNDRGDPNASNDDRALGNISKTDVVHDIGNHQLDTAVYYENPHINNIDATEISDVNKIIDMGEHHKKKKHRDKNLKKRKKEKEKDHNK
jgi:hypothetical protein